MKTLAEILDTIATYRERIPVDVVALSRALGIPVREVPLRENISGLIKKVGPDSYEIRVNSEHSETRKRFTIAHELGHFVLHKALIGDGIVDNAAYRSADGEFSNPAIGSRQETEANKFAANLLMPDESITKLQRQGITTPRQMAAILKVSEGAMKIRLGIS